MKENYLLEGNISVKAAILANRRIIHKLLVDKKKKDKDTAYILHRAQERNIPISFVERTQIDHAAEGNTHGGMLAIAGERTFDSAEALLKKPKLFLAIIEGIEDPFNFGYIIRTLYAAGCDGIYIPPRNWTSAAGTVAKSSAGASEYMPMMLMDDISQELHELQEHHVSIVCGQRSDAISLYDYAFPDKVCIAIGGEMRGLSKAVLNCSTQNIYIPYHTDFKNALNAASAAAVIAFEYVRQSQNK